MLYEMHNSILFFKAFIERTSNFYVYFEKVSEIIHFFLKYLKLRYNLYIPCHFKVRLISNQEIQTKQMIATISPSEL